MKQNIEEAKQNIKQMIETDYEATKLFMDILEKDINGEKHHDIESTALVELMTQHMPKEAKQIFLKFLKEGFAEHEKMSKMQ